MKKTLQTPIPDPDVRYDVSTHFGFGENWANYASHITDAKIQRAQENLLRLLPSTSLQGKTFLDIGCGSGLHTLAALKAGCGHVIAVDFDPNSVKTTQAVLERFWNRNNYAAIPTNILTPQINQHFDIVYSWGVLHHTGDMWSAITNASALVKPGGLFVIALYKRSRLCGFWKKEKAFYTRASRPIKKLCDGLYASLYILGLIATGRNPITYMRTYEQNRGMRFINDVPDWLGGYPYESASPAEVKLFVEKLGFTLQAAYGTEPVKACGLFGSGCAEYVFLKSS